MTYTRRDFVNAACSELGVSTSLFDVPPERIDDMRAALDRMMATWNAQGIRVGYPLPTGPDGGDLDDDTNVPDAAFDAIVTGLAIRCAPMWGKTVGPEHRLNAATSLLALRSFLATIPQRQADMLPAGAGNKPWDTLQVFTTGPVPTLDAGKDGELDFI